jgi:thermitase
MSVRRHLTVLITAAAVALGLPVAAIAGPLSGDSPAAVTTSPGEVVPERVLVKYRGDVERAAQLSLEHSQGASRVDEIGQLGVQVLQVPTHTEDKVVEALTRSGKVEYAERDGVIAAEATPNDSLWSKQWGPAKVRLPEAWDVSRGSSSVVVAVLDTGVDRNHPDLSGRVLTGYDFVNSDSDAADDHGHGTKAAGVAAAAANNSQGVAGGCWTCSVLPVKVLSANNSGTMSGLASGITYSADRGAHVISMSLSGTSASSAVQDAARYAKGKGALLVAAAGNQGGSEPRYPAAFPEVLSVAGSQSNDSLYSWSNYGSTVEVAAPGCNETTVLGGSYGSFCGTSSATPLVAGAAAVLVASGATGDQIGAALRNTAARIGADVAYGRVDAAAAVSSLGGRSATVEPAPVTEPAPEPTDPVLTETTATFSGSLNNKNTSRTYAFTVPSDGTLSAELAYSKAPSMTLRILDSRGNVLASGSGGSPVRLTVSTGAGGHTLEVSGATRGSFTLSVTHRA